MLPKLRQIPSPGWSQVSILAPLRRRLVGRLQKSWNITSQAAYGRFTRGARRLPSPGHPCLSEPVRGTETLVLVHSEYGVPVPKSLTLPPSSQHTILLHTLLNLDTIGLVDFSFRVDCLLFALPPVYLFLFHLSCSATLTRQL